MYMRKAILGAASAFALASPAAAADLPITPYSDVPSYERETHSYEYKRRRLSLSRSRLRSSPRRSSFAGRSLSRPREWWLMNILSM
jgi:opacity protein-like surface antigen